MKLRVKELCHAKNLTLQDLAERVEMKRESLSRAINGNPTVETLEKIADALGVPVGELFAVDPERAASIVCPHCGKPIKIKVD